MEKYSKENNLKPILDPSNADTLFFRNRIRQELVPYLEDYNPNIKQLIIQLGDIAREDLNQITSHIENKWNQSVLESGPGYIGFKYTFLNQQPVGTQRRLIRQAIQILRPRLRDVDFRTVSKATNFLQSPTKSGSIDLLSGLILAIELDHLWFHDKCAKLPIKNWW